MSNNLILSFPPDMIEYEGAQPDSQKDHTTNADFYENIPTQDFAIDEAVIPDGGSQAWMVVVGSLLAMMVAFGVSNAGGPIQEYLHNDRLSDISQSQIGWIFSLYLFLMYFGSVQTGPVFDAYGVRTLIIPGCIGWIASLFILSICKEYYQFILGFSVLGGLTCSMVFNPGLTVLGNWFLKKRGLVTGIAAAGGSITGIWAPLMLEKLFPKLGYGWTIRIFAFILLVLSVVTCILCKDRHSSHYKPNWRDAMVDFRSLRNKEFSACTFAIFLAEWAYFVPQLYLVSYARDQGLSRAFSNTLITYLSIGATIGRITPGFLADRYGAYNITILATLLSGVISFAIWLPAGSSKPGITAFSVLFGVFSGSTTSITPLCVSVISQTKDYGKRYGTAYSLASIAALTGLPIAGSLTSNNYQGLIIFTGAVYIGSSLSFLLARYWAAGFSLVF